MKWFTSLAAVTALATSVLAEDLLFIDTLVGLEQQEATTLGYTTKVVTEAVWRTMVTSDFAAFKAIIIGDDFGSSDQTLIQFLIDTKNVWGPAVTGNMIIHGADQSNHDKTVLIDNSIQFAAAGQSTGFYFSLSQYYDQIAVANVDALSYFGTFEVRGQLNCYDNVHIVATSPAINTLTDAYLSNWGCSVHEAFSAYPSVGLSGFQAIAIADGVVEPGTQTFGDGHSGLPYIITRGATPAGCGNGIWESALGEECDDGSKNGVGNDPCSVSCKCLSGKPNGDGSCAPANSTTPTGPASSPSGPIIIKPSGYSNSSSSIGGSVTSKAPYPTTSGTIVIPPYITPSVPSLSCIGVEIIVSVTIIDVSTTSVCGTYSKPIYNTQIPSMPCYVCAMKSQGICTTSGFITATTTYCPGNATPTPATIYPCATCTGTTLTETCPWATTPVWSSQGAIAYTTYGVHTEHVAPPCSTCTPQVATTVATTVATGAAKSPFCSTCNTVTATLATQTNGAVFTPTSSPVAFTGAATKNSEGAFRYLGAGFAAFVMAML
ncbi:hypothetical protein G7Y89_g10825 [Cudoniella acicularis]|uniref:Uncharacterized protein n=1 Tax=Cudoniella acicularis TaxID=354080 RepID=A0A8H4W0K2_9HELO|nr:hypothetical protein G7Y89_g10825 [Cudoniella acicularis]